MPTKRMTLVLAAVAGLALTPGLEAQSHEGHHKQGEHAAAQGIRAKFDGIVVGIDTLKMDRGATDHEKHRVEGSAMQRHHRQEHAMMTQGGGGLGLRIARAADTVAVHLGPLWYLQSQNPDGFAVGDTVTVDAVEMKEAAHPHWMGYGVIRGELEISLRNEDGTPRWRDAMRARMPQMHKDSAGAHR
jgi:hypothetical protein